jgi:putative transposase
MEAALCIGAVAEALARHSEPDIFNTDQDSQFISMDFTAALKKAEIAMSMDGKGAWRDNVFVEQLWQSIKYEAVYLHAYKTVNEARVNIVRDLAFYNSRRPNSPLGLHTPDQPLLQHACSDDSGGIVEVLVHFMIGPKLCTQTQPPLSLLC